MRNGFLFQDMVSLMAASGENFQTICRAVRKNNYNYLDIDLENVTLDNLMAFRDHCLKIGTIYLELTDGDDIAAKFAMLDKAVYLSGAENVLILPEGKFDSLPFSVDIPLLGSAGETLTGLQEKFAGCDAETAKKFINNYL